jgi:hypothetical protein
MRVPIAREEMRLPERKKALFSTSVGQEMHITKAYWTFFTLLTTLFVTLCV